MGRRRGLEQDKALSNPVPQPETAQNASYCVSCGLAKHPGSTCYAASLIAARIEQERALSVESAPILDTHNTALPHTSVTSRARVARWRERHPDVHRERHRAYMRAYRARGKA